MIYILHTIHVGSKPLTSLLPFYDFDRSISSGCNGFCCSLSFLSGGAKSCDRGKGESGAPKIYG